MKRILLVSLVVTVAAHAFAAAAAKERFDDAIDAEIEAYYREGPVVLCVADDTTESGCRE